MKRGKKVLHILFAILLFAYLVSPMTVQAENYDYIVSQIAPDTEIPGPATLMGPGTGIYNDTTEIAYFIFDGAYNKKYITTDDTHYDPTCCSFCLPNEVAEFFGSFTVTSNSLYGWQPSKPTESKEAEENTVTPEPEKVVVVHSIADDQTEIAESGDGKIFADSTWNLSQYVEQKYFEKAINLICEAQPEAKSISVYTGTTVCFNEAIIRAINEGNKTITYFFKYEGKLYSITIPATVEARKVLEESGEAGPLFVGQQLGTTKLIEE